MPFDPFLAKRISCILEQEPAITSKKMFGGICFMKHGNMLCGVIKDKLALRVGSHLYESFLLKEHTRPFDFTGRPLKGFVYIIPKGLRSDESLKEWIAQSLEFVDTLDHK